jgi:hypothetical protein
MPIAMAPVILIKNVLTGKLKFKGNNEINYLAIAPIAPQSPTSKTVLIFYRKHEDSFNFICLPIYMYQ